MKKFFMGFVMVMVLAVAFMAQAVTLEWDAPTTGGPVVGYKICYYLTASPGDVQNVDVGDQTQYDLDDTLFPYEDEISFYVTAYNAKGEGPMSNIATWTRIMDLPGPCILRILGF